ncbi:MAG TPA: metal-dependent transcriptional regulator [Terrimesophilobacter sp.]|nr:metal-dependent transcriptional regulator [Terrimesophilobacter sp.]HRQ01017.1 metal-dependent transcriptional regulator [Terrimesophilobacter sp.]
MSQRPSFADAVTQDYVKAIFHHTEWQPEPITSSVLAARLDLAASSVTEMVKKLAAAGLVSHVPYGAITLTDAGRELAVAMVRRHRLIETWLVETFGYAWDEVHDEAEVLEHAVSDRLLERIDESLGRPVRDPHGDPIPAADGSIRVPDAVVLSSASAGHRGRVVRISDRDPALLRYLEERGFELDAAVEVVGPEPFGGALTVRVSGAEHALGDEAAASVWVTA